MRYMTRSDRRIEVSANARHTYTNSTVHSLTHLFIRSVISFTVQFTHMQRNTCNENKTKKKEKKHGTQKAKTSIALFFEHAHKKDAIILQGGPKK